MSNLKSATNCHSERLGKNLPPQSTNYLGRLPRVLRTLAMTTLLLLTFSFLLFTLPNPVFAQTPTATSSSVPQTLTSIPSYVPPTSPIYTDLLINNLFHSFSCLAIGQSVIGQPCLTYQITKNAQGMLQGIPVLSSVNLSGGALGMVTNMIGTVYLNPPVRTADYLASVGQDLGIVKEVHAQVFGSGAQVLNPILTLWQVSRNISYVVLIIIFVIIGLMVMFRTKINPQTVITAQAAIPGLIVGLLLITFSYFLAGLITDTAFLGVNVVGYYFSVAQNPPAQPKLVSDISHDNAASIFGRFVENIFTAQGDIGTVIADLFNSLGSNIQGTLRIFAAILGFQAGNTIGPTIGSLGGLAICGAAPLMGGITAPLAAIGGPVCSLVGGVVGGVVTGAAAAGLAFANPAGTLAWAIALIVTAILIYTMLKLLLKLIIVYLSIIFAVITAPFLFLAAALPGRQGIATGWILNLLSNALVFPAVFAVFYFVSFILGTTSDAGKFFNITNQFMPVGTQTLPLLGGLNLSFIRLLLAFGALVATPTIPDIIQRTIGKVSQAGQLLGQEIGGGVRSGQGYYGQASSGLGKSIQSIGQAQEGWYGKAPGVGIAGYWQGRAGAPALPGWLAPRKYKP